MPRFEGSGVDLADPELDWMVVADGLGRGLADLHRLSWRRPGEWRPEPDDLVAFDGTSSQWLEARVAAWLFMLPARLDATSDDLIRSHLELARAELSRVDVQATYVHHDFKPTNLSLSLGPDGTISVVGVFDLNEGYAADPLEDLPRSLTELAVTRGPVVGARYLASYREATGRHLSPQRILAYTVFDLLVFWQFGTQPRRGWFDSDTTFASWVAPRLQAVTEALAGT
jgi:aminoglycoside phosphotransferase (APT) family kinase protein